MQKLVQNGQKRERVWHGRLQVVEEDEPRELDAFMDDQHRSNEDAAADESKHAVFDESTAPSTRDFMEENPDVQPNSKNRPRRDTNDLHHQPNIRNGINFECIRALIADKKEVGSSRRVRCEKNREDKRHGEQIVGEEKYFCKEGSC